MLSPYFNYIMKENAQNNDSFNDSSPLTGFLTVLKLKIITGNKC